MPKDAREKLTPPYVVYASFKSFINGLRKSTVPSRIDRTVMSNYSGSTQYALQPALQWLGLIDTEGTPSGLLKQLAKANDGDFGDLLAPMVREKYGFLFSGDLDLESASSGQVEEAFKNQGISGSTVTKCITFFLQIAKDSKIAVSPHVKAPQPKRGSSRRRKTKVEDEKQKASDLKRKPESESSDGMETFTIPIRGLADGRLWLPKDLDEKAATKALRIIKFNLEQYYDIEIDEHK